MPNLFWHPTCLVARVLFYGVPKQVRDDLGWVAGETLKVLIQQFLQFGKADVDFYTAVFGIRDLAGFF